MLASGEYLERKILISFSLLALYGYEGQMDNWVLQRKVKARRIFFNALLSSI